MTEGTTNLEYEVPETAEELYETLKDVVDSFIQTNMEEVPLSVLQDEATRALDDVRTPLLEVGG